MQTFTAPGDIFPDEGVVSKVDEIPKSGAPKFYINVDDLKAAIDVSFGASANGPGFLFALAMALTDTLHYQAVVKNGGKQVSDVISLGPHVPPFQFFQDTEGNSNAICTRPGK
jgi:predicted enzyme related to lactoylglutathione lyase